MKIRFEKFADDRYAFIIETDEDHVIQVTLEQDQLGELTTAMYNIDRSGENNQDVFEMEI